MGFFGVGVPPPPPCFCFTLQLSSNSIERIYSAPYILFWFENYCAMYYEEEQGCAFSAWLMNEVTLVSADVHIWQVQKQGLWLVAFLCVWQRAQYAADACLGKGKTEEDKL